MSRSLAAFLFVSTVVAVPATAQPSANPISAAIRDSWREAATNLRGSAALMPEARFGFRPVDSVRTYGAILAHVAGANYEFCSAARGEKTPHAEDEFEKSAKTKADIVRAVEESIAYCDQAYASLDDRKAAETIDGPFGGGKTSRASALIGNAGHVNEHYGNLVTYLRMNNLVPPSSAPRK
jgi:uncharacterized damage-inducible protein DinB